MIRVNLLPHREEARKRRQQQFGVLAGIAFVLGALVAGAVWLFLDDRIGWSIFMLVWGFFGISGIDNVVKPILISRGASLPFVLVLLGVLGGILAFGFVGVFLGPTLLAVGFNFTRHWTEARVQAPVASSTPPPA